MRQQQAIEAQLENDLCEEKRISTVSVDKHTAHSIHINEQKHD